MHVFIYLLANIIYDIKNLIFVNIFRYNRLAKKDLQLINFIQIIVL